MTEMIDAVLDLAMTLEADDVFLMLLKEKLQIVEIDY